MKDQGVLSGAGEAGPSAEVAKALAAGRRSGLATAALALGVVSFITVLGTEKALLAIVLGVLAVRGAERGTRARRFGLAAIVLGGLFVVTVVIVLVVFHQEAAELLRVLQKVS